MALLPQELRRAQEQAWAQLPAHDVRPLVDLERQVTVTRDPARERRVDDRLGGRTHDYGLGQVLSTGDGDDRQLGAEASTCSASRCRKSSGISNGKYAFRAPLALMRSSRARCSSSQMPYAQGRMTIVPRTGP